MRIALVDSGLGLLAAAAAVRRMSPNCDLVLSCDPDGMPWGPRAADDITTHALACARAAVVHQPDALIVACNTASVHALSTLRAELEPAVPVVGTVPAVKPAAAGGGPVAVWATPATTGSPYQRRLITDFGNGTMITQVPCHGLAEAVESGDEKATATAVAAAAALTPPTVSAVVLGCTHYELVGESIRGSLAPRGLPPVLYGSADAVAGQALLRAGVTPAPHAQPSGELVVLRNGTPDSLPPAALTYAEGRLLAAASVAAGPVAAQPRGAAGDAT